jgi:hypothetical protein
MSEDLLERLEKLMLIYERTQAMELKKAEIAAKTASDILTQNRKSQLELISYFHQFIGNTTVIKKDDKE